MEITTSWAGAEDLARIPVFSAMDEAGRRALADKAEVRDYRIAETIIHADAEPEDIYFVLSGGVQVQIPGTGFVTLGAGDFFGEGSLVEGGHFLPPGWRLRRRNASVVALEDARLAVLQVDALGLVLRSYPQVREAIAKEAERRS
jgi:CRP-like cAMP-binding protein